GPTMLHLQGIDAKPYLLFGTDIFSKEHKNFVQFRNGDFITPKYSYIKDDDYDNDTGEKNEKPTKEMKDLKETVHRELDLSDKVLYGDLLRFYDPTKDWKPTDTSKYFYGKDDQDKK